MQIFFSSKSTSPLKMCLYFVMTLTDTTAIGDSNLARRQTGITLEQIETGTLTLHKV